MCVGLSKSCQSRIAYKASALLPIVLTINSCPLDHNLLKLVFNTSQRPQPCSRPQGRPPSQPCPPTLPLGTPTFMRVPPTAHTKNGRCWAFSRHTLIAYPTCAVLVASFQILPASGVLIELQTTTSRQERLGTDLREGTTRGPRQGKQVPGILQVHLDCLRSNVHSLGGKLPDPSCIRGVEQTPNHDVEAGASGHRPS
jgi:hypothetical protein